VAPWENVRRWLTKHHLAAGWRVFCEAAGDLKTGGAMIKQKYARQVSDWERRALAAIGAIGLAGVLTRTTTTM